MMKRLNEMLIKMGDHCGGMRASTRQNNKHNSPENHLETVKRVKILDFLRWDALTKHELEKKQSIKMQSSEQHRILPRTRDY